VVGCEYDDEASCFLECGIFLVSSERLLVFQKGFGSLQLSVFILMRDVCFLRAQKRYCYVS
jgi:hypothetical protein